MSLRDEILAIEDLKSETVTIPQWKNKKILIRELTGAERSKLFTESTTKQGKEESVDVIKLSANLVIASVRDLKTGELIFKPGDAKEIMEKSGMAIDRISLVANRLNGFGEAELAAIEKN